MRRVWGRALFCVGAGLFIALIFPKSFLMLVAASGLREESCIQGMQFPVDL